MQAEEKENSPETTQTGTGSVYSKLYNEWFKKVFRLYAVGFVLVVATEIIAGIVMGFYAGGTSGLMYTMRRVVLPSAIDGFLILMNLEIFHGKRASDELKNRFTLVALVCIAMVLSCVHCYFGMRFSIFLVPMISAMAFMDITLMRITSVLSMLGMCISLVLPMLWHDSYDLAGQLPNAALTLAVALIVMVIERIILQLYIEREKLLADTMRENKALGEAIETDDLTGIYNRKGFIRRAQQMLASDDECEYTLMIADVESFRGINESFGEQRADELLQYLAMKLTRLSSENEGLCGRYGGDQFALLLRDCPKDSEAGLQQFDARLREGAPIQGIKLNYGICPSMSRDTPVVAGCDRARLALQTVKNIYGENLAVYHEQMSEREERDRRIENSMSAALENHQFVVYYQPKHDTVTGRMTGAEALVRWKHPEYGMISPADFIPVLEKNGFIARLDYYVWQTVCADLRGWTDSGVPVVPISVNASRRDFLQSEDMSYLLETVKQYGVDRKYLHLEVTESLYTEDAEAIIPRVSLLRDAGIAIEMDDFGTGYSSLGMLHKLPLDVLKLDMSFIRDLKQQQSIVQTMIYLAKNLHLQTVAEGVETEEEREILKKLGCDCIQGYYFSRPLDKDAFEQYLREHAQ